jgi:hypothetical protein
MINPGYQFAFDINFSFGRDSVFTEVNNDSFGESPVPPSDDFLLLTDGTNFLLTDSTFLVLT